MEEITLLGGDGNRNSVYGRIAPFFVNLSPLSPGITTEPTEVPLTIRSGLHSLTEIILSTME